MEPIHSILEVTESPGISLQTAQIPKKDAVPNIVASLIVEVEEQSLASKKSLHQHKIMMTKITKLEEDLSEKNEQLKRVRGLKNVLEKTLDQLGLKRVAVEKEVSILEEELKANLERTMLDDEEEEARLIDQKQAIEHEIEVAQSVFNKIQSEKENILIKLKEQERASKLAQEERILSLQNAKQMSKLESDKLLAQITSMISSNAELEQKCGQSNSILESLKSKHAGLADTVEMLNSNLQNLKNAQELSKQQAITARKIKSHETKKLESLMIELGEKVKAAKEERGLLQAELDSIA